MEMRVISDEELAKHKNSSSCWMAIHGKVYDITKFISKHPGGKKILLDNAGHDSTVEFDALHSPDVLNQARDSISIVGSYKSKNSKTLSEAHQALLKRREDIAPTDISTIFNVFDMENIASKILSEDGWAYYSSGANDEITLRENHIAFNRIWLRPRVLVDVSSIDISSSILKGKIPTTAPIYITATALAKLADPEGEVTLTKAAAKHGIVHMCSTLSSCSIEQMYQARSNYHETIENTHSGLSGKEQVQFYQLYINSDRKLTESIIKDVESKGYKALIITVDAPGLGQRERDMRVKFKSVDLPDNQQKKGNEVKKLDRSRGTAATISTFIDPSVNWNDIKWVSSLTSLPLIIKGIQTYEDAIIAIEHNVDVIILSNHGGRQLDFSRSAIEVLDEVMTYLKEHNLQDKIEVWIDGGIRRGTDIFKALALGAKAVGIGRPFLYGLAAYGQPGVEHVIDIFKTELRMAMKHMGCPTVNHITRSMAITKNLSDHFAGQASDSLSLSTYSPLKLAPSRL